MRPSAQPFLWKWVLFAWEWKIISISKVEHLTSFWYRGPRELGNGLFIEVIKLINKMQIEKALVGLYWNWAKLLAIQYSTFHIYKQIILTSKSSGFFENQVYEICSRHLSKKASKGSFRKPEKLQNHSNERKGKEKKKERGGGKEEKRKKKKKMVALLVFKIASLGSITFSKIRLEVQITMYTQL